MEVVPPVKFDDTATAFSYKSNSELRKARLIFMVVNNPIISRISTGAVKLAMSLHLPIKGLVRSTVFQHFCGGETIDKAERTISHLGEFNVKTILDYSVEGAKTEAGFDTTAGEILQTINKATHSGSIPFCVFKVTGMADTALLEKIQTGVSLSPDEASALDRVRNRVNLICEKSFSKGIPVLIDAEESWIQNPIDDLAYQMMAKYNRHRAIIFNTFQMYRSDMMHNLEAALQMAVQQNYFLGVKLVRGAYMEKERDRAGLNGYPTPIQISKEATDVAFNKAIEFCFDHIDRVSIVCGSHNEYSNQYLASLIQKYKLKPNDPRVWSAQLLGMSDNISFNLAKDGYNVAKYVPYGPVASVMPYLLRRAAENTSVAGQSSRELVLIRKELARRKNHKG